MTIQSLKEVLNRANEKQKNQQELLKNLIQEINSTKSKLEDLGDSIDKNKFAQDRET